MITKKMRKSSRKRNSERKNFSKMKDPSYIEEKDERKPANRAAARIESHNVRGVHGSSVRDNVKSARKARVRKARKLIQKIRKETRRSMSAVGGL